MYYIMHRLVSIESVIISRCFSTLVNACWEGKMKIKRKPYKESFIIEPAIILYTIVGLVLIFYVYVIISNNKTQQCETTFIKHQPMQSCSSIVLTNPENMEENDDSIFTEEVLLLARCVEAEAGNQCAVGKRLVCDVILNRVNSARFPDTISDVIYQKGQFGVVYNGAIDAVQPSEITLQIVEEELQNRTDSGVLFFNTTWDNGWGGFQVQDHWFSY